MRNKLPSILLCIFLFIYAGTLLYFNRSLFFNTFDIPYWQERFEQSQWRLPFSERIIGDEGLYAFEGYSYAKGADPTLLNAEVPPLGKYLIGWSILFTGNPYWIGFVTTLASILVFYVLSRNILGHRFLPLAATIIFAFDPLIVNQVRVVMLDSSQLLFLLLGVYTLTSIPVTKSISPGIIFLTGLFLGSFSATKIPLLTPFFVIVMLLYLHRRNIPVIGSAMVLFTGIITSYLFSYIRFFQLNHTISDWLSVQKWMFTFYRESNLSANIGSVVTTLLFNKTQNFLSRIWQTGEIWSIAWPIITVFSLYIIGLTCIKKKFSSPIFLYSCISGMILMFYFLVPFSIRYLVILLPFLYLLSFHLFSHIKVSLPFSILIIVLLTGNIFASRSVVFPTPNNDIKQFVYDWEHGYFSDMYERLDSSSRAMTRGEFQRIGQTFWSEGQIETAQISIYGITQDPFSSIQHFSLDITYKTRFLGEFTETRTLTAVKEHNAWKIRWNFSDFISGLTSDTHLLSNVHFAKRGTISNTEGVTSFDSPSVLISIIPRDVDPVREGEMLLFLEELFAGGIKSAAIHDRYIIGRIPNLPVAIGIPTEILTPEKYSQLLSYPGIILTPAMGRFETIKGVFGLLKNSSYDECCSHLYSTTSYDGVTGPEQKYNVQLKGINEGTLTIIDAQENIRRIIIESIRLDGEDIFLNGSE